MTMKSCNLVVISSAGFIPIADSGLCGILFQAHLLFPPCLHMSPTRINIQSQNARSASIPSVMTRKPILENEIQKGGESIGFGSVPYRLAALDSPPSRPSLGRVYQRPPLPETNLLLTSASWFHHESGVLDSDSRFFEYRSLLWRRSTNR